MNISENLGSWWITPDDSCFFQSYDDGFHHCRDRRDAPRLPGKTCFTKKFIHPKDCDHSFLALLRHNGNLHLAFF
jgi:hypothetical protein